MSQPPQGNYPPPGSYPPPGQPGGYPPAGPPGGYPPVYGHGGYPTPAGSDHPVQLFIERAESQSRLLALFSLPFFLIRIIAAFPVVIALYVVGIGFAIVAWVAMWAVLFTGHYPEGMHNFTTGVLRWQSRLAAWAYGLTDRYPGFSMQP